MELCKVTRTTQACEALLPHVCILFNFTIDTLALSVTTTVAFGYLNAYLFYHAAVYPRGMSQSFQRLRICPDLISSKFTRLCLFASISQDVFEHLIKQDQGLEQYYPTNCYRYMDQGTGEMGIIANVSVNCL